MPLARVARQAPACCVSPVLPLAAALALAALATPDAPLGLRTPGTFRELFLDATSEDARPRHVAREAARSPRLIAIRFGGAQTISGPARV